MRRFYVPADSVSGDTIIIKGSEAHHVKDVMRLKKDDEILVFDGTGKEYTGVIEKMTKEAINVKINKRLEASTDNFNLALVQAIPKVDKMDYIVEKATELGARRITPVITNRTVVKPDRKGASSKLERWKKIAVAASKQSGQLTIPVIDEIEDFEHSLSYIKCYELAIIPCIQRDTERLADVLKGSVAKSAIIFIGPEGDFTADEVEAAKSKGARPVMLGREVLRSDTAAISVLSVINYELRW